VDRAWRTAVVLFGVGLLVAGLSTMVGVATAGSAFAAPPAADRMFASLDEAADAGAVDIATVRALRRNGTVDAFAILDGTAIVKAYGPGDKKSLATATSMLKSLRDGVFSRTEVPVLQTWPLIPVALVRLTNEAVALRLLNDVAVLSIAVDHLNQLDAQHNLDLVRQPQMGAGGVDGRGTTVVLIDTGADITQPDFGSCTVPGVPASCRVPVMFDAAADDGSFDDNGHGSNTAGIVASVATAAKIVPIDAFSRGLFGDGIMDHDALTGLNWALTNLVSRNIRSVSMSFGTDDHNTIECTGGLFDRNGYQWPFQMLRGAGALPVVSAGNNAMNNGVFTDGISAPACTPGAVRVGAVFSVPIVGSPGFGGCVQTGPVAVDTVACFSQDSSLLDVLAPGISITAGGQNMSGTSMAAPHVAGAAALVAQVSPSSTADSLESFLKTSHVNDMDSRSGRTHPRLDLPDAVRAAAPVPNDNRSAATVLTTWGGRTAQTTWGATKEPGEANHAGSLGGSSIWYRWTPSQSATATFTTDGSDFDTVLAVYRDTGGALTLLGSNDNAGPSMTSAVAVPVTAGDAIFVAIDGVRPAGATFAVSGHVRLTWNLSNDLIAQAQVLPVVAAGATVNVSGANVGATKESGEQHHCGDLFSTASVWYSYTPTASQSLRIRAAGTQLLCLAVYSAPNSIALPAFGSLTGETDAADDQGTPIDVTVSATSGRTYWIAVDGVSMDAGCNPNGQCFYQTPTGPFGLILG
jgi:subtilisin family serine protease